MQPIVTATLATTAVLLMAVVFLVRPHRARPLPVVVEERRGPPSAVRVLRTDAELDEAIRRAALSERVVARTCASRAERYESMLPAPGANALGRPDGEADRQHRLSA